MFDVGFSELVLFAIVALVVLGPEKLPHAARIAGAWVGRIRRSVSAMQAEIEREVAAQEMKARLEQELQDIGGSQLLRELQDEKHQLESSLHAVQQELTPPLRPPPAAASPPAGAAPLLAQAAVPLEQVDMDGEKAYREWLATQRRQRTPSQDSSAS